MCPCFGGDVPTADLHGALLRNLGRFITELGRDFCFVFSIADIALYAYVHRAGEGGFDLTAFPALHAVRRICPSTRRRRRRLDRSPVLEKSAGARLLDGRRGQSSVANCSGGACARAHTLHASVGVRSSKR